MKKPFQSYRTGEMKLCEMPKPLCCIASNTPFVDLLEDSGIPHYQINLKRMCKYHVCYECCHQCSF